LTTLIIDKQRKSGLDRRGMTTRPK